MNNCQFKNCNEPAASSLYEGLYLKGYYSDYSEDELEVLKERDGIEHPEKGLYLKVDFTGKFCATHYQLILDVMDSVTINDADSCRGCW